MHFVCKEKKFSKFGFDAEAKYVDLILDKEQKDWYFFRRFKMSLYDIQDGIDTEMLTIPLEPEAAAFYVKHLPVKRRVDGQEGNVFQTFSPGSKYIVVDAGGRYAESPILIEGIRSFSRMHTIIPQEAAWSVLRGAVIFGHDPSLIRQRRSKYTYGFCIYRKFDSAKHDERRKYEKNGEIRCSGLFSKLVEADELVTVGEYQKEKSYQMDEYGKKGNFQLYSSTSKNPMYVDEEGCFFIGYILTPGHGFLLNEDLFIKMCFGETEIEFNAHQPKSQKTATYYLAQN